MGGTRVLLAVKAKFLKTIMGISKRARSRLIYELTREPFLIEELRTKLQLPSTKNAEAHLAERRKRREEIPLDFYSTDAMLNRTWTNAKQRLSCTFIRNQ
jgi:hypothetical protein